MTIKIFKQKQYLSGFTIIESLAAVAVFAIGILGSYIVIGQINYYTSHSNAKLTAAYLAKEGIELVKNMRDSNWVAGNAWNYGLTNCSAGCEIDYNDTTFTPWTSPGRDLAYANGYYSYDSGGSGKFKRKITITNADPMVVTCDVSWLEKGAANTVSVQDQLYNFMP